MSTNETPKQVNTDARHMAYDALVNFIENVTFKYGEENPELYESCVRNKENLKVLLGNS